MSSTQQKNREYWAKRFPDLSNDWPYWWIEGDSYCLAVIGGGNLAAAVEIVEDNWERFDVINASKAMMLGSDKIQREKRNTLISQRSSSTERQDRCEIEDANDGFHKL